MGPETILKSIKNDWENWPLFLGAFSQWNHSWSLPKLQAHRGFHQEGIIENSLESLSAAKRKGYDMAEIDVQITKDGIPIVFHDFNLRHQYFINIEVSEMLYSDLVRLGNFPKLEEALLATDRPDYLNVEIKSKNLIKFPLEDAIVSLVKKIGCEDSILISSFNPWTLVRIRYLEKNLSRALLVTDQREIWNFYYLKRMWMLPLVEPHVLNIRHSMVTKELISKLKNFNVLTSAWTVNDLELSKNLISLGVDSIISDTILPGSIT